MQRKERIRAGGSILLIAVFTAFVVLSGYVPTERGSFEDGGGKSATSTVAYDADGHPGVSVDDGAELYMTRCMSCHQMNGRGVPGVFPPLTPSEWVTGDKGRLIRIVLNGMTGEMEVGDEVYSGAMPPWQSFLDDEQMAQLLTYIRTSWQNDTTAVTVEEVAAVRNAVEDRRDPWTVEELEDEANQGIPGM